MVETIRRVLKSCTYKPGTVFEFFQTPDDEVGHWWRLVIRRRVFDASNPEASIEVRLDRRIGEAELVNTPDVETFIKDRIRSLLMEIEIHELNEWLKFDGVTYRKPHPHT